MPDHRRRHPSAGVLVRNPPEVGSRGTPAATSASCRLSHGGRWLGGHDQPIRCRHPRRRPRRVRRRRPRRPARPPHRRDRGEVLGRCLPQRRAASPRRRCSATPNSPTSSTTRPRPFGISGEVTFDFGVAFDRSRKVADGHVKGVHFLMKKNKITEFDGRGTFTRREHDRRREGRRVDRDGHLRQRDHRDRLAACACCRASSSRGTSSRTRTQILHARPARARSPSSAPARSAWSSPTSCATTASR